MNMIPFKLAAIIYCLTVSYADAQEVVLRDGIREPWGLFKAFCTVKFKDREQIEKVDLGTAFLVSKKHGLLVSNNHAIARLEYSEAQNKLAVKGLYVTIGRSENNESVDIPLRIISGGFPEGYRNQGLTKIEDRNYFLSRDNQDTTIRDYTILKADLSSVSLVQYKEFSPLFINPLALVAPRGGVRLKIVGNVYGELFDVSNDSVGILGALSLPNGDSDLFWGESVVAPGSTNSPPIFMPFEPVSRVELNQVNLRRGTLSHSEPSIQDVSGGPAFSLFSQTNEAFSYGLVVGNLKWNGTISNRAIVIPYSVVTPSFSGEVSLKNSLIEAVRKEIEGATDLASLEDLDALEMYSLIWRFIEESNAGNHSLNRSERVLAMGLLQKYEAYMEAGVKAIGAKEYYIHLEEEWLYLKNIYEGGDELKSLETRVFSAIDIIDRQIKWLSRSGGKSGQTIPSDRDINSYREYVYRVIFHPRFDELLDVNISSLFSKLIELETKLIPYSEDNRFLRLAVIYLLCRGAGADANPEDMIVFGNALKRIGFVDEGGDLISYYVFLKDREFSLNQYTSLEVFEQKASMVQECPSLLTGWNAYVARGAAVSRVVTEMGDGITSAYALVLASRAVTDSSLVASGN